MYQLFGTSFLFFLNVQAFSVGEIPKLLNVLAFLQIVRVKENLKIFLSEINVLVMAQGTWGGKGRFRMNRDDSFWSS